MKLTKIQKHAITLEVRRLTKSIKNTQKILASESYQPEHDAMLETMDENIKRQQFYLINYPELFV